MKKLSLALALFGALAGVAIPSIAHDGRRGGFGGYGAHGGHYEGHHHSGGWGWVAPALVLGGVIGYEAARPVYVPPPTVYVSPPPVGIAPTGQLGYLCTANGLMYPQTPTCPVPWQLVNY